MRNEENNTQVFSSEQLKTVHDMIGETEPSLFSVLQELSKKYDEKTTIYLTKEFCLNCQTHENQRVGMEFLYMNGFQSELKELIDKNLLSYNQINREWGKTYNYILDRRKNRKYSGELKTLVNDLEASDPTLSCLIIFLKLYGGYEVEGHAALGKFDEELTELMLEIDNTLMRIYFQLRENEILFHYHWTKNDLEIARTYAENIINNTFNQEKRCEMYVFYAQTYIFEDYRKSLELLEKGIEIANEYTLDYHKKAIVNNIQPFISITNGDYSNITTSDDTELAHLAIAKGQNEKAIKILNSFETLTPFQEYFLGLAKDDKELLCKSYYRFINERKHEFFAQLPLKALNKRGWNLNEEENCIN